MSNDKILDNLLTIISFLYENEQYGDDWLEEIATLDYLIDTFNNAED